MSPRGSNSPLYFLRTAEMNVATAATSAAKAVSQFGSMGVLLEWSPPLSPSSERTTGGDHCSSPPELTSSSVRLGGMDPLRPRTVLDPTLALLKKLADMILDPVRISAERPVVREPLRDHPRARTE